MKTAKLQYRTRIIRGIFAVLSLLFFVCIIVQVFLAGMGLFVNAGNWSYHTAFIHVFEFIPLVMLVLSFFGRIPKWIRWQSLGLYIMIIFQYITIEFSGSFQYIAVLHVIFALLLFWRSLVTATIGISLIRVNKRGVD